MELTINLAHKFRWICHDIAGLLTDCNKMSTYCNRLDKQSQLHPNRYDPDKYKGDGLELFAEALIKLSPVDNRIGISKYQVVEGTDIGTDGIGIGSNGNPAAVQVKYRGNGDSLLTANKDHLSNFISSAQNRYGVLVEDVHNMLIITTAKGLHEFTADEMLHGKVRCLGMQELRVMVDNNHAFWCAFRDLCGVK